MATIKAAVGSRYARTSRIWHHDDSGYSILSSSDDCWMAAPVRVPDHLWEHFFWCHLWEYNAGLPVPLANLISDVFLSLFQCFPIAYSWERFSPQSATSLTYDPLSGPAPVGTCLPNGLTIPGLYVFSALNAFTDWSLALLPIVMLWNVNLPRTTKWMVSGLLGCCAM